MAFRLMRYSIAAMQKHLDAGHEQLPLVIPLLFSHGRGSPWPWTLNWTELFASPGTARKLYTGDFPLIDVGAIDDDEIDLTAVMFLEVQDALCVTESWGSDCLGGSTWRLRKNAGDGA